MHAIFLQSSPPARQLVPSFKGLSTGRELLCPVLKLDLATTSPC